jgi:hypothetical protein
MKILVLLFIALIGVLSVHDHSQHVDPKFIHGEALRVAWLTKPEQLESVYEYTSVLRHMVE